VIDEQCRSSKACREVKILLLKQNFRIVLTSTDFVLEGLEGSRGGLLGDRGKSSGGGKEGGKDGGLHSKMVYTNFGRLIENCEAQVQDYFAFGCRIENARIRLQGQRKKRKDTPSRQRKHAVAVNPGFFVSEFLAYFDSNSLKAYSNTYQT
jgi:hypothetical protein